MILLNLKNKYDKFEEYTKELEKIILKNKSKKKLMKTMINNKKLKK